MTVRTKKSIVVPVVIPRNPFAVLGIDITDDETAINNAHARVVAPFLRTKTMHDDDVVAIMKAYNVLRAARTRRNYIVYMAKQISSQYIVNAGYENVTMEMMYSIYSLYGVANQTYTKNMLKITYDRDTALAAVTTPVGKNAVSHTYDRAVSQVYQQLLTSCIHMLNNFYNRLNQFQPQPVAKS